MKLMIVESPNKCKKIKKILGGDWEVKASVGHVRDLPKKELGIELENNFRPTYEIAEDKKKVVLSLKSAAKAANEVWIATDPDREGEAIAFHIKSILGLKDNYYRVTFNEISKEAIRNALKNPRKLDMKMVAAQETRRILDRIFGYIVSPELQKQSCSTIALSAGRVQSPTVGLVVDRQKEIEDFQPKKHYSAKIKIENGLILSLDKKTIQNEDGLITDHKIIDDILDSCHQVKIKISDSKPSLVKPKPPFTTSELQQVASNKLKFTAVETMQLAQKLFEQGRITYHRTDDPNLSNEGWLLISDYLTSKNIKINDKIRRWKSKKNSQEAHEGIRPTDPTNIPHDDSDIESLYRLIYERSLAAVAEDGVDEISRVAASHIHQDVEYMFKASGRIISKMGFRSLISIEKTNEKDNELSCLPEVNEIFSVTNKERLDLITKPPEKFTESSLLKELEKRGIGRPSTYASIFANIFKRGYVTLEKGRTIKPTQLGISVVDALKNLEFMMYEYTSDLEKDLDLMAEGKKRLADVVRPAYEQLTKDLPKIKFNKEIISDDLKKNLVHCPKCNNPIKRLQSKKNKEQFFWVHLDEKHAENCEDFIEDINGKPLEGIKKEICPLCEGELSRLYSKKNESHFWIHKSTDAICDQKTYSDHLGVPNFKSKIVAPKELKKINREKVILDLRDITNTDW